MTLRFTVPGSPRGQARGTIATRGKGGRPLPFPIMYPNQKDVSYTGLIQFYAREAAPPGWEPLTGPCSITIRVTQKMPGPAEWKRRQKLGHWSVTKPDCSNVLKLVEDALSGVAFVDDKQVASVTMTKRIGNQGEAAKIEVEVAPLLDAPKRPCGTCHHPCLIADNFCENCGARLIPDEPTEHGAGQAISLDSSSFSSKPARPCSLGGGS